MAIRLRKDGGRWKALCAAQHKAEESDIYLDDGHHDALTEKFLDDLRPLSDDQMAELAAEYLALRGKPVKEEELLDFLVFAHGESVRLQIQFTISQLLCTCEIVAERASKEHEFGLRLPTPQEKARLTAFRNRQKESKPDHREDVCEVHVSPEVAATLTGERDPKPYADPLAQVCERQGCTEPIEAKGLCRVHYAIRYKTEVGECSNLSCHRKTNSGGLCVECRRNERQRAS